MGRDLDILGIILKLLSINRIGNAVAYMVRRYTTLEDRGFESQ
jgi:hypothetical protein